tara:strand:+ start:1546 stop:2049 length:504 start_codon:yes stop_codon:yes gene_type:complete
MATVLFISEDRLKTSTALNYNIDTEYLLPFVKISQDKHLQAILGTQLYEKLENEIQAGTLAGAYKTLVDDYIQDALVHYAIIEALPFISYKIANGSITQKNSENGTAATKNDVDWLIRKQMDSAEFYGQRIIDYLIYKTSSFPEYSSNSNADIDPIGNAYNCGIKID